MRPAPDVTDRPGARVWMVNHYADAPDRPNGTRHFDLARQLVRRGHEVTIFAAGFSHVTGRDDRIPAGRLYWTDTFDGVRFVWLRTVAYRGNTWRRQVNMLSFVVAFLIVATRQRRPTVIIGSTVHPFAAFGAWLMAVVRRARFVFEIRDLWPQTLIDLGALREGSLRERVLRWIEAFLVRRATVVITLLPGMQTYLDGRGLPSGHVRYLPNGVDLAAFDTSNPANEAAAEPVATAAATMRAEGRFVIGYVGSLGRVNRLDVVLDAAAEAERRAPGRIGLIVVGDGPERDDLVAQTDGRSRVLLHAVPKRAVGAVLRRLDAAVVHTTRTPVYRYGISFNKLFEYLAAARPVLFATESAYDPVAAVAAGITVAPDDPIALGAAMVELAAADDAARAAMGAAGRRYVEAEHDIARLADTLDAIVGGR